MSSRLPVLAVIFALALTVFILTKTKPINALTQEDAFNIGVVNKTLATQVTKARSVSGQVTVALKNNYSQRITALVVSMGNFTITEDFVYSEIPDEFGLKPQETFEKTYPLPSSIQYDPSLVITLQAVVLEDKTGDGDPHTFERIRDERLGQAIQIKRSLKLMQTYLESKNDRMGMNVGKLKTNLTLALDGPESEARAILTGMEPRGSLSREGDELLSDQVKQGLDAGKTKALRKMAEVEHSIRPRETVLATKDRYEKLLARL